MSLFPRCLTSVFVDIAVVDVLFAALQEDYQLLVDGFGGEFLCPVCRDRAMAHMLGDLQVTKQKVASDVFDIAYCCALTG